MSETLENLCQSLSIPNKEINYDDYRNRKFSSQILFKIIKSFYSQIKEDYILIGGQTTHPNLLGWRHMRKPSNDVDIVTTEKGIKELRNLFLNNYKLFYTKNHSDLFLEYKALPFGFVIDYIHDWQIPNDFKDNALIMEFNQQEKIKVAEPEYTIMLKTRRAKYQKRLFGKDKIDITTLILAPHFKTDLKKINFEKTSSLIRQHITNDFREIEPYIIELQQAKTQLRKNEQEIFEIEYFTFLNTLKKEFIKNF